MPVSEILLAAPRGFCAGVAYAIEVVDLALRIHGAPVYVKHAIVHNEAVVRDFEERGAIFVEEVSEIPEKAVVVFSAHGVSPQVRQEANARGLKSIDASCPLVIKVHNEVRRHAAAGLHIVYIGHRGHVEAEGVLGEAPGQITLVEDPHDAENVVLPENVRLALATQTTLSVDEVQQTLNVLKRRFPHLELPKKEDICYATTNRQAAVKVLAAQCDFVIVVGSTTSSNSNRLREVAQLNGTPSVLLMEPTEMDESWTTKYARIGITSGASTPESLVDAVVAKLKEWSPQAEIRTVETIKEDVEFRPHRELINLAMSKS